MKEVEAGTPPYHFMEAMGCPGGCISCCGQPRAAQEDFRRGRYPHLRSVFKINTESVVQDLVVFVNGFSFFNRFQNLDGSNLLFIYL